MTHNVFMGTLNHTNSLTHCIMFRVYAVLYTAAVMVNDVWFVGRWYPAIWQHRATKLYSLLRKNGSFAQCCVLIFAGHHSHYRQNFNY